MSKGEDHISTSAFAKRLNISKKDMDQVLAKLGFIEDGRDGYVLSKLGANNGGMVKDSRYGKYVAWPQSLERTLSNVSSTVNGSTDKGERITATNLGEHFGISASKMYSVLSELGWVSKDIKGWVATDHGIKLGAVQARSYKTGVPFVKWPEFLTEYEPLVSTMQEMLGKETEEKEVKSESSDIRKKFDATFRCTDGHFVRSKAEMLIDNWLYMAEIMHAYERKLPIEEDIYCDFYIPAGKCYIEYWGLESNPKYLERKQKKQEIYKKYDFRLIELQDEHIQNLDDVLPKFLLPYGVSSY